MVALLAVACARPTKVELPAGPTPEGELLSAIETGDFAPAVRALCDAYARVGLPCASTLQVIMLDDNDVMSNVSDDHVIRMQPMPRDGYAYWANWSMVLSGGMWQPQPLFVNELEARRIGRMLLVSVLAHEIGHHVAMRHGCHPDGRPERELRADELSVPLVRELMHAGPLRELNARMRVIAGAMIEAVPADRRVVVPAGGDLGAWVSTHPLPSNTPGYASLHLSRQRRILADTVGARAAAERTCLSTWREHIAGRQVRGGRVTTLRALGDLGASRVAIDRAGHLHRVDLLSLDEHGFTLERLDAKLPARRITTPGQAYVVEALAAASDDRLAFYGDGSVWMLERTNGGALTVRTIATPRDIRSLAFDERDSLVVGWVEAGRWLAGPLDGPARWSVPLDGTADSGWADGRPGRGSPSQFAVSGDRLVFVDRNREAIRAVDAAGIVTLAGLRGGRQDGAAETAELFNTIALGISVDGRVRFVDTTTVDAVLRTVDPVR